MPVDRQWHWWESTKSIQRLVECFWLKHLHFETNYIKFESTGAVILQSLERSFPFFFFFLSCSSTQAKLLRLHFKVRPQQPTVTYLLLIQYLFTCPLWFMLFPSQSLVIALKRVRPQFNDGTLKLLQGRILNLHLPPRFLSKHHSLLP